MDYELFIKKIGDLTGIDLACYKRPQMERRITSLMRSQGFSGYREYLQVLKREPEQLDRFLNHLTINVSEFYRNPNQWEILQERVLPEILRLNPRPKTWSAGCAAGEEPYTLAMLLREAVADPLPRILATDIDQRALSRAQAGVFQERSLEHLPPYFVKKYFQRVGDTYQIVDDLKKMIIFKKHNLLRDPFDHNFDLILCRNVMIYFTGEARETLYRRFRAALKPGGVLFTGSTEQLFQASRLGMRVISSFFYQRTD